MFFPPRFFYLRPCALKVALIMISHFGRTWRNKATQSNILKHHRRFPWISRPTFHFLIIKYLEIFNVRRCLLIIYNHESSPRQINKFLLVHCTWWNSPANPITYRILSRYMSRTLEICLLTRVNKSAWQQMHVRWVSVEGDWWRSLLAFNDSERDRRSLTIHGG